MALNTEFEFTLPLGYVDGSEIHRTGRMRRATALDEIESIAHPRVQENEAYLPIVLLSRVITSLGGVPRITPAVIEQLFAADLAYLEDLYLQLNSYDGMVVRTICPHCSSELHLKVTPTTEAEIAGSVARERQEA
jgi:hypothetical protein